MKKALRNLFWIAVALGAIGIVSDNCSRAEACEDHAVVNHVIKSVDDDFRCWEGNCVIYDYNGVISQECDTFCNFYCYLSNWEIICEDGECWNGFETYCHIDGEPHSPKNHHGLLDG